MTDYYGHNTGYNLKREPDIEQGVTSPPDSNDSERPKHLKWFTFFSLLSIALNLTALVGCASIATSRLYIARMDTFTILNATKQHLIDLGLGTKNHTNTALASSIPDARFFTDPLPYSYLVGMSGVCREYNNTPTTDPEMTTTIECKLRLHHQFDLLSLIAEDIPTTSEQFNNWQLLLDEVAPNFESTADDRARLTVAASALEITSVIWAIFTTAATLYEKRLYPRGAVFLAIINAVMEFSASSMWTVVGSEVTSADQTGIGLPKSIPELGVHGGPGLWMLWAAGVARLAVTPTMLWSQIVTMLTASVFLPGFISVGICAFFAMCRRRTVPIYSDTAPTPIYNHPVPTPIYNHPVPTPIYNHTVPTPMYRHTVYVVEEARHGTSWPG